MIKTYNKIFTGKFSGMLKASLPYRQVNLLFIFLFLAFLFLCFLRLPILSTGDSDLWYHLNSGRYFFEHNKIPTTGFFSYLSDTKQWSNYYWLFQVFIYRIFSISGYYGLVALKAVVFLLTSGTIAYFFIRDERDERHIIYVTTIFIFLCLGLIPRYYSFLRPHIFSYLFIPAAILIIDARPRMIWLLPVITVIWVNMHGVEYPVMCLIYGSYLLEWVLTRKKEGPSIDRQGAMWAFFIAAAFAAILVNPYGLKILETPFNFAGHQHQYIRELNPFSLKEFLNFDLFPARALTWSAIRLLIILSWILTVKALWGRKIRISHLLMVAGGAFLLLRAERFQYEALLLALPVLRIYPGPSVKKENSKIPPCLNICCTIVLGIFVFSVLWNIFMIRAKYPFSHSQFPEGVITFLNRTDTGGRILNSPDHGGYLQFRLNPNYRIAMDLQMIIFSDMHYFKVMNALNTGDGFRSFYNEYAPDYLVVKRSNIAFKEIIKDFNNYKPVFFDNASVLYADSKKHPDLVEQYALKNIDPFKIRDTDIDAMSPGELSILYDEYIKLDKIYPRGLLLNLQTGRLLKKKGDLANAIGRAETIIKIYPEYSDGYLLKGDILKEGGKIKEAITFYRRGLKAAFEMHPPLIYKRIAMAYVKTGEYREAYSNMEKAVNPFSPSADYRDIWQLGNMALMAGDIRNGIWLIKSSLFKAPENDIEFRKRVSSQYQKLLPYTDRQ